MLVIDSLPLQNFPLTRDKFTQDLTEYIQNQVDQGLQYKGFYEKQNGKLKHLVYFFEPTTTKYKVTAYPLDNFRVNNYPANPKVYRDSLAKRLDDLDYDTFAIFTKVIKNTKVDYIIMYKATDAKSSRKPNRATMEQSQIDP